LTCQNIQTGLLKLLKKIKFNLVNLFYLEIETFHIIGRGDYLEVKLNKTELENSCSKLLIEELIFFYEILAWRVGQKWIIESFSFNNIKI
jgi:hypothetical protein